MSIGAVRLQFIAQVEAVLPGRRLARRAVAEKNGWDYRVEAMSRLIEARLSERSRSPAPRGFAASAGP